MKMTPRAAETHFVSSRNHWLLSVQWHISVCQAAGCVTPSGHGCHPNNAHLVCDYQEIKIPNLASFETLLNLRDFVTKLLLIPDKAQLKKI